ncbi:hypothetical protein OROHE_005505 [Orobanche hederae]
MVEPPQVERPQVERSLTVCPTVDRPRVQREEGQLEHRKRRREDAPPARAASSTLTTEQPIAAMPLSEKRPCTSAVYLEEMTVARAETSRGRPYFGRDSEKAERIRREDPNRPPMVVDFLSSCTPRAQTELPSYINRALTSLSKAWTTDLDEVAMRQNPDAVQACFALTLQAATMAAQAVREAEGRPSVPKLQADLESARASNAEFADKIVNMEREALCYSIR